MRSETDLKVALRRAAARLNVELPALDPIAGRAHRRSRGRAAGMLALVLALLAGSWGLGTVRTTPKRIAAEPSRPAPPPTSEPGWRVGTDMEAEVENIEERLTVSTFGATFSPSGSTDAPAQDPEAPPLQAGPRVVKEGAIRLRVPHGAFQDVFGRAQRLAAAHGGFVAESRTGGDEARSGEIVIRVPAQRFEAAIGELKDLGTVRGEEISGVDVTDEFIDLRARLRNWRAQERAVRRLLGEATSIPQTLQLERELGRVRLEAERIEGSIRALRDRADLATISVAMREEGAAPPAPEEPGALAIAWGQAREAATDVVGRILVGAGYLLPLFALLGLAYAGFRLIRPRARA